MSKFFRVIALLTLIISAGSCGIASRQGADKALKSGFVTPPDTIQTSVYWYWISDNISKEGVINDLRSMKKAGINRAFIGNIGLDDVPYGAVKMLSEEWWEILHAALKTATELDIEIGIFNSPGWSQSGGPWIGAEEAMRYLTSSETRITGPQTVSIQLAKPAEIFQDVRVIAFPAPKDDQLIWTPVLGKISSTPRLTGLDQLFDQDPLTGINLSAGKEFVLDLDKLEIERCSKWEDN